MSELPWSKQEIIDAMRAEFQEPQIGDFGSYAWASQFRALKRLALSGRGPPGFCVGLADRMINQGEILPLEQEVYQRLGRIWQALCDERDPEAAYEQPLRDEMQ
jgi:hypothetical protein